MTEDTIWYAYHYTPDEGEDQYLKMECINISKEAQEVVKAKMQEIAEEIWQEWLKS